MNNVQQTLSFILVCRMQTRVGGCKVNNLATLPSRLTHESEQATSPVYSSFPVTNAKMRHYKVRAAGKANDRPNDRDWREEGGYIEFEHIKQIQTTLPQAIARSEKREYSTVNSNVFH